jgi:hypothetical protein
MRTCSASFDRAVGLQPVAATDRDLFLLLFFEPKNGKGQGDATPTVLQSSTGCLVVLLRPGDFDGRTGRRGCRAPLESFLRWRRRPLLGFGFECLTV